LVGEMASLKDTLSIIRRRAKQVSKEQQEESYNPDRSRLAQMTGTNRHPGVEMMNDDQDYVFHDEPNHQESSRHDAAVPIHRGRVGSNLNRKDNSVMFDSGPSSLGTTVQGAGYYREM